MLRRWLQSGSRLESIHDGLFQTIKLDETQDQHPESERKGLKRSRSENGRSSSEDLLLLLSGTTVPLRSGECL